MTITLLIAIAILFIMYLAERKAAKNWRKLLTLSSGDWMRLKKTKAKMGDLHTDFHCDEIKAYTQELDHRAAHMRFLLEDPYCLISYEDEAKKRGVSLDVVIFGSDI